MTRSVSLLRRAARRDFNTVNYQRRNAASLRSTFPEACRSQASGRSFHCESHASSRLAECRLDPQRINRKEIPLGIFYRYVSGSGTPITFMNEPTIHIHASRTTQQQAVGSLHLVASNHNSIVSHRFRHISQFHLRLLFSP